MGYLRYISVAFLFLQLHGVYGDILPMLQGNALATGRDTDLPNATVIDCIQGKFIHPYFKRSRTLNPSLTLTGLNFQKYPFTSHSLVVPDILRNGGFGKFSFAEMEHRDGLFGKKRTVYGLQIDVAGEYAYWLPQGGTIDIPRAPVGAPKYVFTPDFSGCSWTVTPTSNGYLRVRHVDGGHEAAQFNNKPQAEKGGPISYAMQYKDYGYIRKDGQLVGNVPAYAYMHFSDGKWSMYVQHQTCAPRPGNCDYKSGQLNTMLMNYYNQDKYDMITGTKDFSIP